VPEVGQIGGHLVLADDVQLGPDVDQVVDDDRHMLEHPPQPPRRLMHRGIGDVAMRLDRDAFAEDLFGEEAALGRIENRDRGLGGEGCGLEREGGRQCDEYCQRRRRAMRRCKSSFRQVKSPPPAIEGLIIRNEMGRRKSRLGAR